jgi:hypothetical protein
MDLPCPVSLLVKVLDTMAESVAGEREYDGKGWMPKPGELTSSSCGVGELL